MNRSLKVVIVAGEYSGDLLGAGLIRALKEKEPSIEVSGIAGPQMIQAGCEAWYPVEALAVMGIVEPLKNLPRLINIRRQLRHRLLKDPPDVFIGIDSPDFNLSLEVDLKKAHIPTVHYVSPSVWAWRKYRLYKIKKAVDLMLTLFTFETSFYQEHHIPVHCVGHPLADQIPLQPNTSAARDQLNIPQKAKVLALLPGSRRTTLKHLAQVFIETAEWCRQKEPQLHIIAAMINERREEQFRQILQKVAPHLPLQIITGQSPLIMEAADVILLASGTATLEALLLKKPMVVAYRFSALTYFIAKRLVKLPYYSLPNLLAQKQLVPEFIQAAVTKESLGQAILEQLKPSQKRTALLKTYHRIHLELKQNASHQAAIAVLKLIEQHTKDKS